MKKIIIKNRHGLKIVVIVEISNPQKGLVFISHGLSGDKDQRHIQTFAEAFKEERYSVVRFDTTNTFGESDGNYEDATTTNYYEDLEDVINWAKLKDFYQEPFCLVGHSLGGLTTLTYAENYPEKVKGLAPISTVVSGQLSAKARGKERMEKWEKIGWEEELSRKGIIKRLKWSHMIDRLNYDALSKVNKLTMPVILIVGDKDTSTPLKHQKILFDKLPGKKKLHIIKDGPHTFKDPKHLLEIKQIFKNWIKSLD
jgi:uncharacterized protein